MRKGLLFVLSSPSGGGKTTLREMLLANVNGLACSVSCTTREPRANEQEGVSYYFLSENDFNEKLNAGEFLEHATVFGNSYGTLKSTVFSAIASGKDILLTIDVQGAMQIKKNAVPAIFIFLKPPSIDILKTRLINRNTDSPAVIEKRLHEAKKEISYACEYDYVVINDTLDHAYEKLLDIIKKERSKR